jgi:hypothetical protein
LSDAYPLGAYHKRYYIALAAILGSGAYMCLAAFTFSTSAAAAVALLMFFGHYQVVSVLCV